MAESPGGIRLIEIEVEGRRWIIPERLHSDLFLLTLRTASGEGYGKEIGVKEAKNVKMYRSIEGDENMMLVRIDERVGFLVERVEEVESTVVKHGDRLTALEQFKSWVIGIGVGVTGLAGIIAGIIALAS